MKSIYYSISLFIFAIVFTACVTSKKTSTIVGTDYDAEKDCTNHFVLPYGSVSMPGKWNKDGGNLISGQQFFKNKDSIGVAIAFNPSSNYEFNKNGALTGFKFAKAFYEWDSKYFVDHGLNRILIEQDSINNFIVYRIYGNTSQRKFDTYFLIGEKNKNASNFSITYTDKWTEQKKVDFLKTLFLVKKEG